MTTQRLLLIRTSALGDVIQTFYVITDIRKAFPDLVIYWCVDERFVEVASLHPDVNSIISFPSRRWRSTAFLPKTWLEVVRWIWRLRSLKVDASLDLQGLYKSALIGWLSGAAARFGKDKFSVPEGRADVLYSHVFSGSVAEGLATGARSLAHEALRYPQNDYSLDSGIQTWRQPKENGLRITMIIGASRKEKRLSNESWVALCRRLLDQDRFEIELLWGNDMEKADAIQISQNFDNGQVIFAPKVFPILEISELFHRSMLVMGGDTGLTHLSTAFGVPTIILFLTTVPARYTHPDLKNQFYVDGRGGNLDLSIVLSRVRLALEWAKHRDKHLASHSPSL